MQKNEIGPYFAPLTKIHSKWIKVLNISPETVKLLEENIGEKLFDTGLGNDFFFDVMSKAKTIKAKINKWAYIKIESFCKSIKTST